MRRAAKGTSTLKRRIRPDGNTVGKGWNWPQQSLVVVGKGTLHHRIQIGVAAAKEEALADAALDCGLNALRAKGLGVQSQLVSIVGLKDALQTLLLGCG